MSTVSLMSLAPPQAYTKETVQEAFAWLNEQQSDWSLYIKDIDIAVRLYLKSRKQGRLKAKQNIFTEELKKICSDSLEFPKNDTTLKEEDSLRETPLAKQENKTSPPDRISPYFPNGELPLDSRSQNVIEQAKEDLNLTQDDEVLRLLIQMGYRSLQSQLK